VLELDVPAVRAPVVDHKDIEVLERPLEHASASVPGRGSERKLVEWIGAVRRANAIYATQHLVERARRTRGRSGSLPYRYGHLAPSLRHASRQVDATHSLQKRQVLRTRVSTGLDPRAIEADSRTLRGTSRPSLGGIRDRDVCPWA
jgi:hypothetical protein